MTENESSGWVGWVKDHANAVEAGFWLLQSIPAFLLGWVESTAYVSGLSVYALVKTSWAAHLAHQAKKKAEE